MALVSDGLSMNALQLHDAAFLKDAGWLIGVDEAGRGALAGPVVAGACVLGRAFFDTPAAVNASKAVNDSKQLSSAAREDLHEQILELQGEGLLVLATGQATVDEIAELNILGAVLSGRAHPW